MSQTGQHEDGGDLADYARKFASTAADQKLTSESIIDFLRSHRDAEGAVGGVSAWMENYTT